MAQLIYSTDEKVFNTGATVNSYLSFTEERIKNATTHQITVTPDGDAAATGKLKVGYRSIVNKDQDGIEWVTDGYGSTLLLNLADGVQTIVFTAAVAAFAVMVDTEVGGGVDIKVGAAGW